MIFGSRTYFAFFNFKICRFYLENRSFLNCKKYSTYAEISILKLVEVNVLLLFGISLAKWIWHPCSIGISDKYLSKIYPLCFTIRGRFQSIIALAHVNYYIKNQMQCQIQSLRGKSSVPKKQWLLNNVKLLGHLGGSVVDHLPLAQVMIPGSWDWVPHQAPCREPASPSACVSAPFSVSLMNK